MSTGAIEEGSEAKSNVEDMISSEVRVNALVWPVDFSFLLIYAYFGKMYSFL